MFRYIIEIAQYLIFDCNIDIAVSDCDPTGAASEKLDIDVVVTQKELDSFEGNNPSIVIHIGLLWDFVCKILEFLFNCGQTELP